MEARIMQDSPVLLILIAIYTSRLIKSIEEYISAKGRSLVDELGWVATGIDVNRVSTILKICAVNRIK